MKELRIEKLVISENRFFADLVLMRHKVALLRHGDPDQDWHLSRC